jgi:hypothetical protein
VGLDLGALTPEEIAVAIVAELIAVRRHSPAALAHMNYSSEAARRAAETPGSEDPAEVQARAEEESED